MQDFWSAFVLRMIWVNLCYSELKQIGSACVSHQVCQLWCVIASKQGKILHCTGEVCQRTFAQPFFPYTWAISCMADLSADAGTCFSFHSFNTIHSVMYLQWQPLWEPLAKSFGTCLCTIYGKIHICPTYLSYFLFGNILWRETVRELPSSTASFEKCHPVQQLKERELTNHKPGIC